MRTKIVAGNWKMNNTHEASVALTTDLKNRIEKEDVGKAAVILCTPFPYLLPLKNVLGNSPIQLGAQDCSAHDWGAYTGEVSAPMLKSMNIPYVIIGHSERRQYHGESSALLAQKVDKALANGIKPIFCCGELLEVREKGTHEKWVTTQVQESLFHLSAEQLQKVVVAYEPVWAIGTGKTATAQQAQEMHTIIRKHIAGNYGKVADTIPILYGGSVNAANAAELFSCPDVDGGLVGGASLKAPDFFTIIKAAK